MCQNLENSFIYDHQIIIFTFLKHDPEHSQGTESRMTSNAVWKKRRSNTWTTIHREIFCFVLLQGMLD